MCSGYWEQKGFNPRDPRAGNAVRQTFHKRLKGYLSYATGGLFPLPGILQQNRGPALKPLRNFIAFADRIIPVAEIVTFRGIFKSLEGTF